MSHIIDTSVLMALMRNEPGADTASKLIPGAHVTAIILSETANKLFDYGETSEKAWQSVIRLGLSIHPFDTESARIAASLRPVSRPLGLSFSDCACLALGIKLGLPVYTADRAWAKLKIGLDIRLIR